MLRMTQKLFLGGMLFIITLVGSIVTAPSTPVAAATNCLQYVSDVNYQDGTTIGRNQSLTKKWKVKNCGTSTWTTSFIFRRVSHTFPTGASSAGTFTLSPGNSVAPGVTATVFVTLTTGSGTGSFKGNYKLETPAGTAFGEEFWFDLTIN